MSKLSLLTPIAAHLPSTVPFVGPETQERQSGRAFSARLGANECGFGPSPIAIEAMAKAAAEAWKYPDPENHDLRSALAAHCDVAMSNIVIDTGIDTLLGVLIRLIIGPGDAAVTSAGAYPTFAYHVKGFGGEVHVAPYRDDREDPDALIALAEKTGAKLIYFANPDNPMGTVHSAETVLRMIDRLPKDCLLLLDEAYVELAPSGTAPAIDPTDPRVIRMRTFSKGYGLAGARVGYAIGAPELIRAFDKVRNHFGISRVSQAGALAALADQAHLVWVKEQVIASRQRLSEIAVANGLTPLPSATNFVTMDCGGDGAFAKAVLNNLIARGIFIRMPGVPPLDRCIRISCGPAEEIADFAAALPAALATAREAVPA